jgi:hypothetical protein
MILRKPGQGLAHDPEKTRAASWRMIARKPASGWLMIVRADSQIDDYVWWRLRRFLVKRQGRHLRAGKLETWTSDFFFDHGLHRLRGTVRYPEAA